MSQINHLNPTFPIYKQAGLDVGPVVLVNIFTLDPADEAAMLEAWKSDAEFMTRQPGAISTQFHRSIGEGCVFLNYAIWESTAAYRAAFSQPEFQARIASYPPSVVVSPCLFQKLAVPGVCVA